MILPVHILTLQLQPTPEKLLSYPVWAGNQLELELELPEGVDLTGVTAVIAEICQGGQAAPGTSLVGVEISGEDLELPLKPMFSSDAMGSLPLTKRVNNFWMVVNFQFTNGRVQTFYAANLEVQGHGGTLQATGEASPIAYALQSVVTGLATSLQGEATARENADDTLAGDIVELQQALAGLTGVDTVTPPLDGLDDTRGALWAHCYDSDAVRLYIKVSLSPHKWVGFQGFDSL